MEQLLLSALDTKPKMNKRYKILIGVVFYNESEKLEYFLEKFKKIDEVFLKQDFRFSYQFIFYDDGSTDDSNVLVGNFLKKNQKNNVKLISNKQNRGVGYTIKKIINYGLGKNFDICVIMAGNGKDDPMEVPILIKPIIEENFDYVQGSRFLKGGLFKNLPAPRSLMIKGFTLAINLFTGTKFTDSSNGFRAYKLSIFNHKGINIQQDWLDRYEMETYLHYKVLTLGFKMKEVAVSKNYLSKVKNYSKIRPVIDWWKMCRPIFLLKFRIKN